VDIQNDQITDFRKAAEGYSAKDGFTTTPNLRGRITKLGGVPVDQVEVDPSARWALKGDRGITYSAKPPRNAEVIEGSYWPEDYSGPPLISFDADLARQLRLKIGDNLSVNVMGREVTATISNFRRIDWGTAGINFFMVFSPGIFERAPHTHLATLRVAGGQESEIYRKLTDSFPNVSVIRVKEAIDAINNVLQRMKTALLAASSVTILAGMLVLGGAMAAGQRRRNYEAVVLKVLGMTRAQILRAYIFEYAILGGVAAALALAAGNVAAWLVITKLMGGTFILDSIGSVEIALLSIFVTVGLGLLGTLSALSAKSSGQLRAA
jgi:putative ABC transport system permease protein